MITYDFLHVKWPWSLYQRALRWGLLCHCPSCLTIRIFHCFRAASSSHKRAAKLSEVTMLQENEIIARLPEYQLYTMAVQQLCLQKGQGFLFFFLKEWKNSWGQKLLELAQGKPPSVINWSLERVNLLLLIDQESGEMRLDRNSLLSPWSKVCEYNDANMKYYYSNTWDPCKLATTGILKVTQELNAIYKDLSWSDYVSHLKADKMEKIQELVIAGNYSTWDGDPNSRWFSRFMWN